MKSARGARTVILMTVVVNMLGVGLAWPILPKLIEDMQGGAISTSAASYAWLAILYAVAQFLFSPLMGALSDRFGRRPVIMLSLAGLGIDYALTALAPTLWWLAIARLVSGVFGSTMSTANAAMADISAPEDRARNFGYVGAAFGLGFILGPVLGGLLGEIDLRLPFWVAAGLAGLNVCAALVFLPETLPPERRGPFDGRAANPVAALAKIAAFPALGILFAALFVTSTAQRGLESIWVLYVGHRFGWGVREAALSLAFVGLMFFVVQATLVGPVVRRFGESNTVIGGFAIAGLSLLGYGLADEGWMVYPLIALDILGVATSGPALAALCSRAVGPGEQGRMQGALASVNALAVIVGPFAAAMLLSVVTRDGAPVWMSGIWFILAAGGFLAMAALLTRQLPSHPTVR